MKLPSDLLASLEGLPGFDRDAFVAVHEEGLPPTSARLNPAKPVDGTFVTDFVFGAKPVALSKVPWCESGYYLSDRPSFTFDPLFHAGCYYVQEASSMFLEQALRQLVDLSRPLKVLDLCAAPGGKTTHLQTLLSQDSLLVSNEVIKPRSLVLTDNVQRWGCDNVLVSNNDPKAFASLPGFFDVMVVDAPCSGSGLFRKDKDAVDEWSLHNVALCSQRQQRILADALPCLKEGGLLVYSTCSYSAAEDEQLLDWLTGEMGLFNAPLRVEEFEGIVTTHSPQHGAEGYRFYPYKIKGEGFFLSCFRKSNSEPEQRLRTAKPALLTAKEMDVLRRWVASDDLSFLRFQNAIFGLPSAFVSDFATLQPLLNLRYVGVAIGEIMREKLIPHHGLALNKRLRSEVTSVELPLEDAVRYLQRQDLTSQPPETGWQVVKYRGQNLGWINALKNRVNNYYPKEIRILKQHNNASFKN